MQTTVDDARTRSGVAESGNSEECDADKRSYCSEIANSAMVERLSVVWASKRVGSSIPVRTKGGRVEGAIG